MAVSGRGPLDIARVVAVSVGGAKNRVFGLFPAARELFRGSGKYLGNRPRVSQQRRDKYLLNSFMGEVGVRGGALTPEDSSHTCAATRALHSSC